MNLSRMVLGWVIGLGVIWLVLLGALWRACPDYPTVREMARILPDTLRLIHRLARDRCLLRGLRVRLWLLLGYLALPIDVVPDFIPVIGYADDIIVIFFVLRSVYRSAGLAAMERHWPGSASGLAAIHRLARVRSNWS